MRVSKKQLLLSLAFNQTNVELKLRCDGAPKT